MAYSPIQKFAVKTIGADFHFDTVIIIYKHYIKYVLDYWKKDLHGVFEEIIPDCKLVFSRETQGGTTRTKESRNVLP